MRAGFQFNVQKQPVAGSSGGSLAKEPYSDLRVESHLSGRKSSGGGASTIVADS